jgi:hypothetical protein
MNAEFWVFIEAHFEGLAWLVVILTVIGAMLVSSIAGEISRAIHRRRQ